MISTATARPTWWSERGERSIVSHGLVDASGGWLTRMRILMRHLRWMMVEFLQRPLVARLPRMIPTIASRSGRCQHPRSHRRMSGSQRGREWLLMRMRRRDGSRYTERATAEYPGTHDYQARRMRRLARQQSGPA